MQTLPETRAVTQRVFNVWHPQIVFDLHQMQVNGPRFVLPPYIDPYDPSIDPLIQAQVNALGSSIAAELTARGKAGVATSAIFDAFSPSRAYSHYRGGVRILAEAASARLASPIEIYPDFLTESRGFDPHVAANNHPIPWTGGTWKLRDIVDYFRIATWALLEHASRFRDRWIRNFAAIQRRAVDPETPRSFAIAPLAKQRDPHAARDLIELLQASEVEIRSAGSSSPFEEGTLLVSTAQPAGAWAKTLLEEQDYPIPSTRPHGDHRQPYDITSHSLPLYMGVEVEPVEADETDLGPLFDGVPSIGGYVVGAPSATVYAFSAASNNAYRLMNRFLSSSHPIMRLRRDAQTEFGDLEAGTFLVELDETMARRFAEESGERLIGFNSSLLADTAQQHQPSVGLYRSWRHNAIEEGWCRFVLEQHGFPLATLRDDDIRDGSDLGRYDVIILPHQAARDVIEGNSPIEYPAQYAGGLREQGLERLRQFTARGGTLIAIDGATEPVIRGFRLSVRNVLTNVTADRFSAPGSLLRVVLNRQHPIAWGYREQSPVMFVSSAVFEPRSSEWSVARYPDSDQLLNGWLTGGRLIAGRSALLNVPFGSGHVILFGFRPHFRAQMRVTYRLLFNAILSSTLEHR
jgi:hypothetical protein